MAEAGVSFDDVAAGLLGESDRPTGEASDDDALLAASGLERPLGMQACPVRGAVARGASSGGPAPARSGTLTVGASRCAQTPKRGER